MFRRSVEAEIEELLANTRVAPSSSESEDDDTDEHAHLQNLSWEARQARLEQINSRKQAKIERDAMSPNSRSKMSSKEDIIARSKDSDKNPLSVVEKELKAVNPVVKDDNIGAMAMDSNAQKIRSKNLLKLAPRSKAAPLC